jgi:hypothetical protein|tara:strand:- start:1981 stop:2256 length:276 start_codon:yes stop_codon:yes gene_type:complete
MLPGENQDVRACYSGNLFRLRLTVVLSEITRDAIRRGVFKSVPELEAAIDDYLAKHTQTPKPFVWTATAQSILGKVDRARQALIQVKSGNS